MTEAVRPKFVVPVHGEYRMLYRHKEFLKNHVGYADENVILIENGDVLELDGERARVTAKREVGRTFIDESGYEEIDREVVRERRQLAYDGVVTPVVTIDSETGELEAEPEVVARGLLGADGNGLVRDMQRVVAATVEAATPQERRDSSLLKERVRLDLKRYIQKQTGAKPVILPVVVQL
jgi:ribonuclease J